MILATGPDGPEAFRDAWARETYHVRGIPDPGHKIAKLYEQRWRLLGFGRQPSVIVIGPDGRLQSRHDGGQMWDIPSNEEVLKLIPDS